MSSNTSLIPESGSSNLNISMVNDLQVGANIDLFLDRNTLNLSENRNKTIRK